MQNMIDDIELELWMSNILMKMIYEMKYIRMCL